MKNVNQMKQIRIETPYCICFAGGPQFAMQKGMPPFQKFWFIWFIGSQRAVFGCFWRFLGLEEVIRRLEEVILGVANDLICTYRGQTAQFAMGEISPAVNLVNHRLFGSHLVHTFGGKNA